MGSWDTLTFDCSNGIPILIFKRLACQILINTLVQKPGQALEPVGALDREGVCMRATIFPLPFDAQSVW
jgi:hypothetical protein